MSGKPGVVNPQDVSRTKGQKGEPGDFTGTFGDPTLVSPCLNIV